MPIEKRPFSPTYITENGLFLIDINAVSGLPFKIKERSLVNVPPMRIGGNHKHPRWEAFVGIGPGLKLIWQDENSLKYEESMYHDENLTLFIISPHTPHAVINESKSNLGVLLEFASEVQHEIETVELI